MKELFNASDFNNHGYIKLNEYMLLINSIEPKRFTFD